MAEPVCPYCRMPFDEASPPKIFCTACGMPHHEDCYLENGGCTVFGCKRAPADDPKLQVSQSDLSAVSVPVQQYAPVAQQYAPLRSNTLRWCSSPLRFRDINHRVTVGRWVCRRLPPRRPRRLKQLSLLSRSQPARLSLCPAGFRYYIQEPDNLYCSWHFSWRAGHSQFLCRIHGPCCRTTVPYRVDARNSQHGVVGLGHH